MTTLLHVTGDGHEPLTAFAGHLVRNLEWDRYSPASVDGAVDTVVASLATPEVAVSFVAGLRDAGCTQPVILLADGSPGWHSVSSAFPSVVVVDGVDALRTFLERSVVQVDAAVPDGADADSTRQDQARRHVPRGGTRGMLQERLGDLADRPRRVDDPTVWASLAQARRPSHPPQGTSGLTPGEPFTEGMGEARPRDTALADDQTAPRVAFTHPRAHQESAQPTAGSMVRPSVPEASSGRGQRRDLRGPDRLVASMLAIADQLYGVRETGSAVVSHAREAVGVDAVVALLPDGAVWSVVGAVGHRHLEERLLLGPDHWLVREVAHVRHGVIVEDTDVARSRLAGAPLAAWPHLLACPIPEVDGFVVMARSDNGPVFTSRDLAHASEALVEAGALLRSAVQVRELARRIRRHAELDDPVD